MDLILVFNYAIYHSQIESIGCEALAYISLLLMRNIGLKYFAQCISLIHCVDSREESI